MSAVSHRDFYDPVCSHSLNTTRARLKSIRRKMMTKVQMSTISSCTGMCLRRFVVHTHMRYLVIFFHINLSQLYPNFSFPSVISGMFFTSNPCIAARNQMTDCIIRIALKYCLKLLNSWCYKYTPNSYGILYNCGRKWVTDYQDLKLGIGFWNHPVPAANQCFWQFSTSL